MPELTWKVNEIAHIMGGVSMDEGMRLAQYASAVPRNQAIVELGAQGGASTCWLAMGARKGHGASVYAIDLWDARPEHRTSVYTTSAARERFHAQIAYCAAAGHLDADGIHAIQGHSAEVGKQWNGKPVGLLHVDAMHTYEACKADLESWTPYVPVGGVIVVHDWALKAVRQAVRDWKPAGVRQLATYRWDWRPRSRGQWIGRRER